MSEEGESKNRAEVAEAFYREDRKTGERTEVKCSCGRRACVRLGDEFFCGKCWEFYPEE